MEKASNDFKKLTRTDLNGIMSQFNQAFNSDVCVNGDYSIKLTQSDDCLSATVRRCFFLLDKVHEIQNFHTN